MKTNTKVSSIAVLLGYFILFQTITISKCVIADFFRHIAFKVYEGIQYVFNAKPLEVFLLIYTRESIHSPMRLDIPEEDISQLNGKILNKKPLVFIIHGFLTDTSEQWMAELAQAYLQQRDAVVFAVDWGSNAQTINYLSSADQVPNVANEIVSFINTLIIQFGVQTEYIHIIGHSLGAHIAGNVGKGLPGVYRITGLDPAGPKFMANSPTILSKTDASNVDVLHTDFDLVGNNALLGTVDFFINYDVDDQPACVFENTPESIVANVENEFLMTKCSHHIAIEYFIESIKNMECKFVASTTIERANQVTSSTFDSTLDTILGLATFHFMARGKLYITTRACSPYCRKEPSSINCSK